MLERGWVGAEASSAAAGILSAQSDLSAPGPLFDLCQAARRLYPSWVASLERRAKQSVGYHEDGLLQVTLTERETTAMARQARWQVAQGLRVERWSAAEVHRLEPSIDGRVAAGFFFPTEGQVDNVRLMRVLAAACRAARVRLEERTAVQRVIIKRGEVRGALTDHGRFRAPIVVNCLGSWGAIGGAFPVPLPLEPVRGQILAFQGPRRLLRHVVMSSRAYMVQRREGTVIVGSTLEHAGFDKALTAAGIHTVLRGLRRLSRAFDGCALVDTWAGLRPWAPDGLPILGATKIGGLYVATGHYRHGILLAPITATLMADLILTGRPALDLAPFSPARFSPLRPDPTVRRT